MTTLITQKIGSGPTRRCDARCHYAKKPECTCVCGGMNHGAGGTQAIINTHKKGLDLMAEGSEIHITQEDLKKVPDERQFYLSF